jgi:hypothetical protein
MNGANLFTYESLGKRFKNYDFNVTCTQVSIELIMILKWIVKICQDNVRFYQDPNYERYENLMGYLLGFWD